MMKMMNNVYLGHTVYLATQVFQNRKHKKKRINKKWQKRYGYTEIDMMPHDKIIMTDNDDIWMTKRTWEGLKNEM